MFDYEPGADSIELGAASVAAHCAIGGRVLLLLDGDGDMISVFGAAHYDDILFA